MRYVNCREAEQFFWSKSCQAIEGLFLNGKKYGKNIYSKLRINLQRGKRLSKLQKIVCMLPLILVIFLTAGIVSALNPSDASASVFWSADTIHPATNVGFRVTFNSNTDQQLIIQRIGVHFDWMDEGAFSGKDLSSNPQTLPSHGNYTSDPIFLQVPYNVSVGSHTYFVGVDGVDSSGNFTWSGPNETIQITYTTTGSTTPNPTPTPGGNGQAGSPPNLVPYLIIVAVVAIVIALAVIVKELRKKPKQVTSVTDKPKPATDQPQKEPQKDNYDI